MLKKKATEDQFNELHNLVTKEFLKRIKTGEATTQDLKAACDWLAKNDINGVALEGNPLSKLASIMPSVDQELVQSRLYGKR
jgi:TPR repeat protein